ncbi:MAG: BatA domain-containing protein, partial [Myxococcota bacterium]|nr:BatA domain-containing protein [Myxococcota bacterium]
MTWLSPWSLLWLGLTVPLVLLYVLKRRRVDRVIGSTLLWEAALRDLRAERPWKRLIPTIALLLQLLAIVLGALALARPAGAGGVPTGATIALVVDVSTSMDARSGEGDDSRLER